MTYPVSEDTLFLKNYLEKLQVEGRKILEVGTGTGEVAIEAAKLGANVTAVDKNPEAVKEAEKNAEEAGIDLEVLESDLFEKVDGKFDFILFNPPYLPGEPETNDALLGGEKGVELTRKFLEDADNYLTEKGEVYFIGSSLAELELLENRFDLEVVDEKRLWFETLFLYRLST